MKQILTSSGLWALVSDEDFLWALNYNWYVSSRGYVTYKNKYKMLMHIETAKRANIDISNQIDHKDRNKLNCQRNNLRAATHSQNQMNRFGFKGYYWDKARENWRARIEFNGKRIDLGRYYTEAEARNAYEMATLKYFGEFASVHPVG